MHRANQTGHRYRRSLQPARRAALREQRGRGNITFDSIVFAKPQAISLGGAGTLNIPSNTSIAGATTGNGATLANLVTVARDGASRDFPVFTVPPGVLNASIAALVITNGGKNTKFYVTLGGGINNSGYLTISNCTISNNNVLEGGAIYNTGTVTLSGSTLSGNCATEGSAIFNDGNGSVTLTTAPSR